MLSWSQLYGEEVGAGLMFFYLFLASLAIYTLYLLQIQWFRVIVALVITPVIVLETSLWTVILRFYTR